jgi:hypothetical protein
MSSDLEALKTRVEQMNKTQHLELLHILRQIPGVKLNENKSGIYINLPFLPEDAQTALRQYVEYITMQESAISFVENQKDDYMRTFFPDPMR